MYRKYSVENMWNGRQQNEQRPSDQSRHKNWYSNVYQEEPNRWHQNGDTDDFPTVDVFNADVYAAQPQRSRQAQPLPPETEFDPMEGLSMRETGIVEKMLASYGFVQCCERQARLFFHFSQYTGNPDYLKIGDAVEFSMSYDRRTGKPIASVVSRIDAIVPSKAGIRVGGKVSGEIRDDEPQGRITYETDGQCFFLPFGKQDIEGKVTLRIGDIVSFETVVNNKGVTCAKFVRLENGDNPVWYQGVVDKIGGDGGVIKRADVVSEITFRRMDELAIGDNVKFNIRMDDGKELAYNVEKLPFGTVVFEDISDIMLKGQVMKPLEKSRPKIGEDQYTNSKTENLKEKTEWIPGSIKYRDMNESVVEIPFGRNDLKRQYSLRFGDWVEFQLAVDRRDQSERATNISLCEQSLTLGGEIRGKGVIINVDKWGVIKSLKGGIEIPFKVTEILTDDECEVGDEVEFTAVHHPTRSTVATRIKLLPRGTLQLETLVNQELEGVVHAVTEKKGTVTYTLDKTNYVTTFLKTECIDMIECKDDVKFSLYYNKYIDVYIAKNLKKIVKVKYELGFISSLKEDFGFIEAESLDRDHYFKFSKAESPNTFEVGMAVDYQIVNSDTHACAENVRKSMANSFEVLKPVCDDVLKGVVKRRIRTLNSKDYSGMISADDREYEFGFYGLQNKRNPPNVGDTVEFQTNGDDKAINIVIQLEEKLISTVEKMCEDYGFLSYQMENGRNVFFHKSQVTDNVALKTGDRVEFVLSVKRKTGKAMAKEVTKIDTGRPEHLISRMRLVTNQEAGPRMIVIRQPNGPDAVGNGFSKEYQEMRNKFLNKNK